ncbi:hypothetical protein P8C59_003948 [Phyllachora maydis]|uniref:RNA 3'-terminal phosphate cyclase-like protein n=1 Tax=Phyllachora maydis TaxID=1825666 RepID=A0AAD9MAU8_9PEZI|nr:hypothetical protein P8C59_003948 [Phyllachora maydis]
MSSSKPEFLRFTGHRGLITRLVLATLTGKPIHISKIRSTSPTAPGLAPHEISFLRLLEAITNGSAIDISYSGTTLAYQPGLITGTPPAAAGDIHEHVLPAANTRGVSYFLLPLALLAPFSKAPLNIRLGGPGAITAATARDMSADAVRAAVLPLYAHFGIPTPQRCELRILTRSCAPRRGVLAAGAVELRHAAQVRLPRPLHALHRRPGRVRRVRGVAYCTGTSASGNARMTAAARAVLRGLAPDVHVAAQYDPAPLVPRTADGESVGRKRAAVGFGISLVAESSAEGVLYAADAAAPPEGGTTPEEVGTRCALQLLETMAQGGCVTAAAAPTVLALMAMGGEDLGRVRLGRDVLGREETVMLARDLKQFGAASWGIREVEDDDSGDFVVTVKGIGVGNVGRKVA